MNKPRLLDLFSGAGGAAFGYAAAGFDVTGVDIQPMPRYPYAFVQADALEYLAAHGHEYAVIHCSPPCQGYTSLYTPHEYPRLIPQLRDMLEATGKPYVIENVEGARREMRNPMMLCGSMFPALRVRRHRFFESNVLLAPPCWCSHTRRVVKHGRKPKGDELHSVTGHYPDFEYASIAMGINWMNHEELSEAIPPAYTHWIGAQLMQHLGLTPLSWPKVRAVQERLFA